MSEVLPQNDFNTHKGMSTSKPRWDSVRVFRVVGPQRIKGNLNHLALEGGKHTHYTLTTHAHTTHTHKENPIMEIDRGGRTRGRDQLGQASMASSLKPRDGGPERSKRSHG